MTRDEIIESANRRCGFNIHNGLKLRDFDDSKCVMEVRLTEASLNPRGMAHGGLVFSLCDTAAGVLAALMGKSCVTLSADIRFLHPSCGEYLYCVASMIKGSGRVLVADTKVYDDRDRLTASATVELFVLGDGEKREE